MKYQMLFPGYIVASIALFLYSFTQVDLSLTLSSSGLLQTIQKAFQFVGFYQRTASTALFLGIVGFWFFLYAIVLRVTKKGMLSMKHIWSIVGVVTGLLVFSYPAFSYDLFNYIFTAKTILVYHKNPYEVVPLQFAGIDPLVAVMRWTHLPSAYTPLWILLTLPAYLLGFGKFLLVVWNLKLLVALFYLAAVRGVQKVLEAVEPTRAPLGTAIFALNPLVVIESLVGAHNDIAMMAIAMWAVVFFLEKRRLASWFTLALSVAVKLMTLTLVPVMFLIHHKAVDFRKWSLVAIMLGFLIVLSRREPLPWYGVWFMPFVALFPSKRWLTILFGAYTLALLLRYAPYLYYGNWNAPVPILKWWVTIIPVAIAIIGILLRGFPKVGIRGPNAG
ncbi:hypothetical protein HY339_02235, partial [Candidatus Gottesmanbacteria bacterium]|nr:hypothetical protein [Candidatus Gottesmanbacteria bacterium]